METVTCPKCDNEFEIGAIADRIGETVYCPYCGAVLEIIEELEFGEDGDDY